MSVAELAGKLSDTNVSGSLTAGELCSGETLSSSVSDESSSLSSLIDAGTS